MGLFVRTQLFLLFILCIKVRAWFYRRMKNILLCSQELSQIRFQQTGALKPVINLFRNYSSSGSFNQRTSQTSSSGLFSALQLCLRLDSVLCFLHLAPPFQVLLFLEELLLEQLDNQLQLHLLVNLVDDARGTSVAELRTTLVGSNPTSFHVA